MKTSKEGLRLITQREGKVLHVYKDSQGYPTAGVGHLLTAAEKVKYPVGTPITLEQCQDWLKQDVVKCENAVNSLNVSLSQNEFDALVSLAFNIGVGGFNRSTVAKRLRAGKHRDAAEAILLWDKPPEIRGRRRGEYHQFLTPYSAATILEVDTASVREGIQQPPQPVLEIPPDTTPAAGAADKSAFQELKEHADAVGDKIQSVNTTVEKFTFPSLPTGLGTRIIVGWLKLQSLLMMVGGAIWHYRDWLYVAVILALIATWAWSKSRDRNNPPGAGIVQTHKWWEFWK